MGGGGAPGGVTTLSIRQWTAETERKEAFGVTRLGDLIEAAARANRGRSMQAAADLATQRGAPISKSHISKNSREVDSITPQLIRGIAAGYDIPEDDVARAALEDLGFVIPDYQLSPESALRRDPTLSSEARAMLLAAIGAARSVPTSTRGKRYAMETAPEPPASPEADEGEEAASHETQRRTPIPPIAATRGDIAPEYARENGTDDANQAHEL